ncbi:MAG: Gfo/Idh/MocA family oxidoreductase [Planctomycetota bacterium]
MKLRVGLVGLGTHWQSMHRPALRMLSERFDVRAVYADVAKLAENAAMEFQADPCDGYQMMVRRDDIDAILVLESSWLRFLPAMAACRAGRAVFWAGQLDLNPQTDGDFMTCVENSGVAFMASLPRRFAPATLRLKELIATHLGPPQLVFCHKRINIDQKLLRQRSSAKRFASETGFAGMKQCDDRDHATRAELIEMIDWTNYVMDSRPQSVLSISPATEVTSNEIASNTTASVDSRSLDYQALTMSYQRESTVPAMAQLSCGTYIPSHWPEAIGFRPPAEMQVRCQSGIAFIDLPNGLVWFDDAGRHQESLDNETSIGEKMLGQFHRAVTSLIRNVSGLDDVHCAASVLRAVAESQQRGCRIDL